MERKDAEIDDEVGVAVVFDEEEQESDEEEGYEIKDEEDDEEEEGVEGDKDAVAEGEEEEEDALVIGGASSSKAGGKAKADKDIVSPHSIDAFWVQRLIAEVYSDPQTASDKTIAVLSILGSESTLRDSENQLMELFDYQSLTLSPSSSKIVMLSYGVPSLHVAMPTNVSTWRSLCARKV